MQMGQKFTLHFRQQKNSGISGFSHTINRANFGLVYNQVLANIITFCPHNKMSLSSHNLNLIYFEEYVNMHTYTPACTYAYTYLQTIHRPKRSSVYHLYGTFKAF